MSHFGFSTSFSLFQNAAHYCLWNFYQASVHFRIPGCFGTCSCDGYLPVVGLHARYIPDQNSESISIQVCVKHLNRCKTSTCSAANFPNFRRSCAVQPFSCSIHFNLSRGAQAQCGYLCQRNYSTMGRRRLITSVYLQVQFSLMASGQAKNRHVDHFVSQPNEPPFSPFRTQLGNSGTLR